jgi:uncharacterized protein (TIGR02145 family)/uncharacterized repeat protein (TIGR02543 family)
MAKPAFSSALTFKNAKSVVGWIGSPDTIYARKAIDTLLMQMVDSGKTVGEACQYVNLTMAKKHDDSLDYVEPDMQLKFRLTTSSNPAIDGTVDRSRDATAYKYGETVKLTAKPSTTSYRFTGWTGGVTTNTNSIDIVMKIDTSVTANFIRQYTIAFNSQGGTSISPLTVDSNGLADVPSVPIRVGYSFEGWYKEVSCENKWDFKSDHVLADKSLYAKWKLINTIILWNSLGSQSEVLNSIIGQPGEIMGSPSFVPAISGYGMQTNDNNDGVIFKNILPLDSGTIEFWWVPSIDETTISNISHGNLVTTPDYLFWIKKNCNTGSEGFAFQYGGIDCEVRNSYLFKKNDRIFIACSWKKQDAAVEYGINVFINNLITIQKHWVYSGDLIQQSGKDLIVGSSKGYPIDVSNSSDISHGAIDELKIYNYVKTDFSFPSYSLTYDGNGNTSGSVPAIANYIVGIPVFVAANTGNLTKAGYDFAGWNTLSNGSGIHYAPGGNFLMTPSNLTLYAQWIQPTAQVMDIDGNVYHTVAIGSQTWMVENLITTKYNDGIKIPEIKDQASWMNLNAPGYCCYYQIQPNPCDMGGLYDWYAVNTGKLAPIGWHVPSESEWNNLITYLGGTTIAGGKLKATTQWFSPNTGATNETGFTALPAGYRDGYGTFLYKYKSESWWTSVQINDDGGSSPAFSIYNDGAYVYHSNESKNSGFSVRCIKD